jgi:hypothetical protein
VGGDPDGWGLVSAAGGGMADTDLVRGIAGPRAGLGIGPNSLPLALFSFVISFLFLFTDFLVLFKPFCKFHSNQFKQNPKIFYCSLQCFKSVINQVFKIKYVFQ